MTVLRKRAATAHPVHDLIAERWSPRAFADREVSPEHLGSLLEAARWAASCFNEQPWSFAIATRAEPERHAALAGCLVPGNQAWAERAPVLMFSVARTTFARNGMLNPHAWHDVGLATAQLCLQAVALGLVTHQMAGYDADRARAVLGLPEGQEPVAAIALGHPADPATLDAETAAGESAPRARRPLAEIVHAGSWGPPAELAPA